MSNPGAISTRSREKIAESLDAAAVCARRAHRRIDRPHRANMFFLPRRPMSRPAMRSLLPSRQLPRRHKAPCRCRRTSPICRSWKSRRRARSPIESPSSSPATADGQGSTSRLPINCPNAASKSSVLNTLKFFWQTRKPEEAADAVTRIIGHYGAKHPQADFVDCRLFVRRGVVARRDQSIAAGRAIARRGASV